MVESFKFRSDSSGESQMVFFHAIELCDRAGVA